jgi:hypothetical protein
LCAPSYFFDACQARIPLAPRGYRIALERYSFGHHESSRRRHAEAIDGGVRAGSRRAFGPPKSNL